MDSVYVALAARLGQAAPEWQGAMQDALWALFRGDFGAAERLEEQALRSGRARSANADCSYRLAMFIVRRAQGRLSEVENGGRALRPARTVRASARDGSRGGPDRPSRALPGHPGLNALALG
jgi:hypothetical protein